MPSKRRALDLIGRIYDAAADSGLWPAFLERLGQVLEARAVTIYVEDVRHHVGTVAAQLGFDGEYMLAYDRYYRSKRRTC